MCWLVLKEKNKTIPIDYIVKAQDYNKDGYGLAYFSTKEKKVLVFKTLDFEEFLYNLNSLYEEEVIVHLRNATVGEVIIENVHPFRLNNGYMFHNGTIDLLVPFAELSNTSDSKYLAHLLNSCKYSSVEDIRPLVQVIISDNVNRLIFIDDNGNITKFNNNLGITENNIWYSNDYHLKEEGWCRV